MKVENSCMISAIITTHNRPELLGKALKGLINQTLDPKDYEIIIGDSYSENGGGRNQQIVNELILSYPQHNISYFYESCAGGYTLTKNNAVKRAESEFILFCDDDAIVNPDALRSCVNQLSQKDVGITTGSLIPEFEVPPSNQILSLWAKNDYGRFIQDFTVCDFGNSPKDVSWEFVWTSNFGCKKTVFLECGGFGPDGFGGDLVLYNGMGEVYLAKRVESKGLRIVYVPGMTAQHLVAAYRFKAEYFKARHYYYGITMAFYSIRNHGKVDSLLLLVAKQVRGWLGCVKQLLISHDKMAILKRRAFLQGYFDHQQAVRHHPEMLDYVCRDNWLDFDFSTLKPLKTEKRSLW